jgi:hypothetical protein
MRAPLHRRTEKIGACVADPFANGEGAEEIDTFTIPVGRRRRVYRPSCKVDARKHALSTPECRYKSIRWRADEPRRQRGPLRVIFDRRDAPTTTVGLPSAAEGLDLLGQSGSSTFDSFHARSAPTTE